MLINYDLCQVPPSIFVKMYCSTIFSTNVILIQTFSDKCIKGYSHSVWWKFWDCTYLQDIKIEYKVEYEIMQKKYTLPSVLVQMHLGRQGEELCAAFFSSGAWRCYPAHCQMALNIYKSESRRNNIKGDTWRNGWTEILVDMKLEHLLKQGGVH